MKKIDNNFTVTGFVGKDTKNPTVFNSKRSPLLTRKHHI